MTSVKHLEPLQELQGHQMLQYLCAVYVNWIFHPALPSPVSQTPQRSGGSPVGRCHCTEAPAQYERLSAERDEHQSHAI